MSQSQFFIFIEGKNSDGFVHGNNCDKALADLKIQYELIRSDQIGSEGRGKTRLISHFKLLSDSGLLINNFKGKVTASAFLMDKDLDDFRGSQIDSDHVIYTHFYDVENHIFNEGDLQCAISAACNLAPQRVRQEFPDASTWNTRIAKYWQEWVRLCFTANMLRLDGEANYGRPSPLNPVPYAPPHSELIKEFESRSHKMARQVHSGSCQKWWDGRMQVDALYEDGRHDEIFKGKWYAEVLARYLMDLDPDVDKRALASVLVRQMASTMTFDSKWSREVQSRVRKLAVSAGFRFPSQRVGADASTNDCTAANSE